MAVHQVVTVRVVCESGEHTQIWQLKTEIKIIKMSKIGREREERSDRIWMTDLFWRTGRGTSNMYPFLARSNMRIWLWLSTLMATTLSSSVLRVA